MSSESPRFHLLLCDGPSCGVVHESERLVARATSVRAADPHAASAVQVWSFTCFGLCDDGPNGFVCPAAIAPRAANAAPASLPARPHVAPPWPGVEPPSGPGGVQYTGLDEDKVERLVRELGHTGE